MSYTTKVTSAGILINGKPIKGKPKTINGLEIKDGDLYLEGVKHQLRDDFWEPADGSKIEYGKASFGNITVGAGIGRVTGGNIHMEF